MTLLALFRGQRRKDRFHNRKARPCAERKNPVVAILIGCYLVAALTHLYLLFTGRSAGVVYGVGALLVGFAFHTLMLGVSFASGTPEGWGPWLSGMAWVIILMYLIVYARYRDIALGGFRRTRGVHSRGIRIGLSRRVGCGFERRAGLFTERPRRARAAELRRVFSPLRLGADVSRTIPTTQIKTPERVAAPSALARHSGRPEPQDSLFRFRVPDGEPAARLDVGEIAPRRLLEPRPGAHLAADTHLGRVWPPALLSAYQKLEGKALRRFLDGGLLRRAPSRLSSISRGRGKICPSFSPA